MESKFAGGIDEDTYADWEEAFNMYANPTTQSCDIDQLRLALLNLGKDLAEPELNAFMDNQSFCTYQTFTQKLTKTSQNNFNPTELREAILVLDKSGEQRVTVAEFRWAMRNMGNQLDEDDANMLVKDADPYNSGLVDVNSFVTMLTTE